MAEQQQQQQQRPGGHPTDSIKNLLQEKAPTASQAMSVAALLPVGGILLALSGITLVGTIIALALATPVFVLFSPVLVPAAVVIGLAVTGFLTSGALGLTGMTSLTWIVNYLRRAREKVPEQMDYMKRRVAETAGQVGQRTKEVGQGIQNRAHEQQQQATRT